MATHRSNKSREGKTKSKPFSLEQDTLTVVQEKEPVSHLEICSSLGIKDFHNLRGHTILIDVDSTESSYLIEKVCTETQDITSKHTTLIIPSALMVVVIEETGISLQHFRARGSEGRKFRNLPFKKIVFFYNKKRATYLPVN